MPDVIAAIAPKRASKDTERECFVQVRAELLSLGGAVMLGICFILTALFALVMSSPETTPVQRVIGIVLFIAAWAYLLNSVTERLSLVGDTLVFASMLNARRSVPLGELDAIIVTQEGLNLERGIVTLELRRDGRRPDRVSLGPCWQQRKLDAFVHSVQEALSSSVTVDIRS